MKRLLSLVLVFFILACLSAPALASKVDEPFSIRNGYHWGMPREQVLALAAEEGLVAKSNAALRLGESEDVPGDRSGNYYCNDVPVGRFIASTMYLFFGDEVVYDTGCLTGIIYIIDFRGRGSVYADDVRRNIPATMKSLYGEPKRERLDDSGGEYLWETKDTEISILAGDIYGDYGDPSWMISYLQHPSALNTSGL